MAEKSYELVVHPYEPVYSKNSKVLILGTIASPKSRANGFYYTHPQNRFWKVFSNILGSDFPVNIEDKKKLFLDNDIALWDVLKSALVAGASDSSIKEPIPNDLNLILNSANIRAIFITGKRAYSLYNKLCLKHTNFEAVSLPSTSPANCAFSFDNLIKEYSVILKYLH